MNINTSDASEPTFWRAKPSFELLKNEPKRAQNFFDTDITLLAGSKITTNFWIKMAYKVIFGH